MSTRAFRKAFTNLRRSIQTIRRAHNDSIQDQPPIRCNYVLRDVSEYFELNGDFEGSRIIAQEDQHNFWHYMILIDYNCKENWMDSYSKYHPINNKYIFDNILTCTDYAKHTSLNAVVDNFNIIYYDTRNE